MRNTMIFLAVTVLAWLPMLWGHDAFQFVFCGFLTIIGWSMTTRTLVRKTKATRNLWTRTRP